MSKEMGKGKILFTGNNKMMLDNMVELVGDKYEIVKCALLETDLRRTIKTVFPHAMVIYLVDEMRVIQHVYDSWQDNSKYKNIPVILVGKEEDCLQFQNSIRVKHMEVFSRPLDRIRFQKTLDTFVLTSNEGRDSVEDEKELEETIPQEPAPKEPAPKEPAPKEPAPKEPAPKEPTRSEEAPPHAALDKKKSILVVDDDVRMLNTIKLYLQDLYDVTVVPSGKLALKFISKKHVDLVLLDYMMPEMNGPEVLREIRENSKSPDVPVLFLTGVSGKNEVLRGLEFRPNGYLLKPITREALLERVIEAMLEL